MKPPRSILDPSFRYRPSHHTDIRRTFMLARRRMVQERAAQEDKVVNLNKRRERA